MANETGPEEKILEVLRQHEGMELYTKKVAELAKLSPSTAAKYLGLLERDEKVIVREQKPYKYWTLKVKKGEGL